MVVASEDGRRETTQVKREFTAATFVLGLFTYGICLVTCWEYPGMVFVPIAPRGALRQQLRAAGAGAGGARRGARSISGCSRPPGTSRSRDGQRRPASGRRGKMPMWTG